MPLYSAIRRKPAPKICTPLYRQESDLDGKGLDFANTGSNAIRTAGPVAWKNVYYVGW